jgi:hypothetical protein
MNLDQTVPLKPETRSPHVDCSIIERSADGLFWIINIGGTTYTAEPIPSDDLQIAAFLLTRDDGAVQYNPACLADGFVWCDCYAFRFDGTAYMRCCKHLAALMQLGLLPDRQPSVQTGQPNQPAGESYRDVGRRKGHSQRGQPHDDNASDGDFPFFIS